MTRRILLADDSVTIQKVVELTFMEEDFEVVTVGSGESALAELERKAPDLVIADVHMPGADGFQVCRQVKEKHPAVPVLLLVGTFEPFDPGDAEACGADGHLKKPFDSQDLLHTVQKLLGAAAEPPPAAAPPAPEAAVPGLAGGPDETPPAESPAAEPVTAAPEAGSGNGGGLAEEEIEKIARRVVELLSDKTVREVAWEVVPDLAEVVIRDRLRELESQAD